jgi:eukaryotic-like serine/threonine-protein kinase
MAMVGEVIAGRFELEELVGTGGMSSVYRARDALLERRVALKILHDYHGADEETTERFRREARAAAQLSHPNIVTVIDRGEDEGRQYIVFEYVEGETLKDLIERTGALPIRRALELAIEIGSGLAFAHRHGLVHRDVKPQNVLLNGDGTAKVTDFGIARSLDVEHGVTQTGTVLGTSNYIAPEQASGQPVNAQTDVYSLGVVLFELLTGEVPFPGENFVAVAMRHVHEEPPSVLERRPETPLRVVGVVERALEKDPRDRFVSMEEFVAELRTCLAALGDEGDRDATLIVPSPVVREGRPHRARQRRSAWPVVVLLLGLALIAATFAAVILTETNVPVVGDAGSAPSASVKLRGVASWDPQGDDREEHPEDVGLAADGDDATYWPTSTYENFSALKEGVGIVLQASGEPSELTVTTDTPGFTAEIRAGPSASGPFDTVVSPGQRVNESTTFELRGEPARFYVVWITDLDGRAHINEVTASS